MLVVLGDTHRREGHGLAGRTLDAVRAAEVVAHTGDFTTTAVYESLAAECRTLHGVAGNNDDAHLVNQLPSTSVFTAVGLRVAMVHGHEQSAEARSLLGREVDADLVVSGHSHRPGVERVGDGTFLNPGSHADPRWDRPAHAELVRRGGRVHGRLVEPDGSVIEAFRIRVSA